MGFAMRMDFVDVVVDDSLKNVKVNGKILYVNVISVKRNTYSTKIEAYNEYANKIIDDDNE